MRSVSLGLIGFLIMNATVDTATSTYSVTLTMTESM